MPLSYPTDALTLPNRIMAVLSKQTQRNEERTILKIATLNITGLGGITKRKALNDLLSNGDIDVLMVTETMLYDGQESVSYVEGFRGYYASISANGRTNNKGTLSRAKWGVAIFFKDGIKVGSITRGDDTLQGRVMSAECAFEGMSKPIHFIATYAPVSSEKQEFWEEYTKWIKTNIPEKDHAIVGGDLNDHWLGAKLERWPHQKDTTINELSISKPFLTNVGFYDTQDFGGDFDIQKNYTFTHYNGTIARLDYILATKGLSMKSHRTFNCDKISTGHRVVKVELDLEPFGGAIHHVEPFKFDMPIKFDKDPKRAASFMKKEEEWQETFKNNELAKLGQGPDHQEEFISKHQEHFLEKLADLCVTQAGKIWPSTHSGKRKGFRCKEAGIITGMSITERQQIF